MMHSSKMHFLVHLLSIFSLLPNTTGFVSSMAACRRLGGTRIRGAFGRSTEKGASASVGRYRKSGTRQHVIPRMGDRVTEEARCFLCSHLPIRDTLGRMVWPDFRVFCEDGLET